MGMRSKWIQGNLVYYDSLFGERWLDAQGPTVCKFLEEFVNTPFTSANVMSGYTTTNTNATLALLATTRPNGELLITLAGADNDAANIQALGEAFLLANNKPCYFGARLRMVTDEITQNEIMVGLCVTDTDVLTAVTDGVYFRKIDGSTAINFVIEHTNAETATIVVPVAVLGTWYTLEWIWDGVAFDSWVNGVLQARPVATNRPHDLTLTPTLHVRAGEIAAKTYGVDWIRAIQIN